MRGHIRAALADMDVDKIRDEIERNRIRRAEQKRAWRTEEKRASVARLKKKK